MINPAKPEIKAARPRTYTTLWDTIPPAMQPGWRTTIFPKLMRPFQLLVPHRGGNGGHRPCWMT
jgi:hypothetical protein